MSLLRAWTFATALLLVISAGPAAAVEPLWWPEAQASARRDGYRLVTLDELNDTLRRDPRSLLLDVRPDYEYRQGHIPGARNLEFHLGHRFRLEPSGRKAFKRLLGDDLQRPVLVYCRSFR